MPHPKKTGIIVCLISFIGLYSFYSCKKTDANNNTADPLAALNLPATAYNYANQPLPNYLRAPNIAVQDNTPITNPITDWGATLGRVLFYDKTISINNSVSCASCHKQNLSFADDRALSLGFAGGSTGRNSMSLVNVKYYLNRKFFWDERAGTLEIQALMPIQDHVEMGMNFDTLINRLKTKAHYPVLFQKAFGSQTITSDKIAAALAQFVRSIISFQSKFDAGRAVITPPLDPIQTPYPNFTLQENQGKQLFFNSVTSCNACHGSETFTAPEPKNNGVENPSVDKGVGAISNINAQIGNFKASSLKNIELTAPYMHDGRFITLEQVVEHYNSGIEAHPNLSTQLRNPNGTPKRLNLTDDQKAALVAFLKTLTDVAVTTDVKFSNPFK
jgi:cytochrome c peroxidase